MNKLFNLNKEEIILLEKTIKEVIIDSKLEKVFSDYEYGEHIYVSPLNFSDPDDIDVLTGRIVNAIISL